MKIAILILSTSNTDYSGFIDACKKTWVSDFKNNGIDVFFNIGCPDNESLTVVDDVIESPCGDGYRDTLRKTYHAMNWLFDHYDLVYRTNLSSYIDYTKFIKFIDDNSVNELSYMGIHASKSILREHIYSKIGYYIPFTNIFKKVKFASGSGFFIGKSVFNSVSDRAVSSSLIDDFGIAYFGAEKFLSIIQPERYWLGVSKEYNDKTFHFRFKSSNRLLDVSLMEKFHLNREYYIKNYEQN